MRTLLIKNCTKNRYEHSE